MAPKEGAFPISPKYLSSQNVLMRTAKENKNLEKTRYNILLALGEDKQHMDTTTHHYKYPNKRKLTPNQQFPNESLDNEILFFMKI